MFRRMLKRAANVDFSRERREPATDGAVLLIAAGMAALCGEMRTMPGLSTRPAAFGIDIDDDGTVHGLS